jgi:hypothetical protein
MSQRRSNASPAELALASARNSIELSLLTALPHARAESLRAEDTPQGTRQDAQPGTQEETQPDDERRARTAAR